LGDFLAASIAKQNRSSLVDPNHPLVKHLKLVGDRVCEANGLSSHRYFLVHSPEINAFVLPGRNVFVFTGLLPVLENQAGLAMVLGHEMSHCLAGHGSDAMAVALPLTFFAKAMAGSVGELMMKFGFTLRKSRHNEHEADVMGLHLLTAACYDTREGVNCFRRMEKVTEENPEDLEWGKTHPHWKNRVELLESVMTSETMKQQAEVCTMMHSSAISSSSSSYSLSTSSSGSFLSRWFGFGGHSSFRDYHFLGRFDYSQPLPPMKDVDFDRLWTEEDAIASSTTTMSSSSSSSFRNMKGEEGPGSLTLRSRLLRLIVQSAL
jgi:predicted Zn-dependent protease